MLKHFFTDTELQELTERIDASQECGLNYHPLLTPGERLPVNDPHLQPRMEPRPGNPSHREPNSRTFHSSYAAVLAAACSVTSFCKRAHVLRNLIA